MKKFYIFAVLFFTAMLTGSIYFTPYQGKVKILVDGKVIESSELKNKTVFECLKLNDVSLNGLDIVSPSLNSMVSEGTCIKVVRVNEKSVKVSEILPVNTVKIYDSLLHKDECIDLEPGTKGFIEKEYKVLTHDNNEVWRKLLSMKTITKQKNQKIIVGTSTKKRNYMMTKRMKVSKIMTLRATGYYPGPEDCGPHADGITASGLKAGYGVAAVDPKVIALGTKLYVETYGFAIAADTGGAIKGSKIDLCFETYKESYTYTPRNLKVYILK
jgi:3D (Asp-Asp-Asp) domain-containing protein